MSCEAENPRKLAALIHAKLDACDNGEGMECVSLDTSLKHYARACYDFVTGVREWAQCIFSGTALYDREIELGWREEGQRLYQRAEAMWQQGSKAEIPCWDLPGQGHLGDALVHLNHIVSNWVSPKLSIAPGPRVSLTGALEEMQSQVQSLEPLSENWSPEDKSQRARYVKAKTS